MLKFCSIFLFLMLPLFANAQFQLDSEALSVTRLNGITFEDLDKDIDLTEDYGQYAYFKTMLVETEVDQYLNCGLARFHTFHYIGAVRCLRKAVQLDPKNSLAHSFLAVAYVHFSRQRESIILANYHQNLAHQKLKLNKKRTAWIQFLTAVTFTKAQNVTQIKPLDLEEAYQNFREATNDDVESLTFGEFLTNSARHLNTFANALELRPDHVGAHHYLVHGFEAGKLFDLAAQHAEAMAKHAPDSSHAQHMFGHILPRLKRWDEAQKQFILAAELHQKWADKYSYELHYDWHYSHNLDLLGATYVALGLEKKAIEAFRKSCPFDTRACFALVKIAAVVGDTDSINYAKSNGLPVDYDTEPYLIEADLQSLIVEKPKRLTDFIQSQTPQTADRSDSFAKALIALYAEGVKEVPQDLSKKINEALTFYANSRLGCASFDGWGKGLLDLMRLLNVTKKLNYMDAHNKLNALLKKELGIELKLPN